LEKLDCRYSQKKHKTEITNKRREMRNRSHPWEAWYSSLPSITGEGEKKTKATPGRQPGMLGAPPPFPVKHDGRGGGERKRKEKLKPPQAGNPGCLVPLLPSSPHMAGETGEKEK